jgi:hypothetical protein
MPHLEIRSYDYVNHPYERVRNALAKDPAGVFRAATKAAAARARSVAAELRVSVAGLDVAAEIALSVGDITEEAGGPLAGPSTRIPVSWEAARNPRLFPLMHAVLSVYPLTATETQLDFLGHYDPPLGIVGETLDALVGRRLAEASVHRFIGDVGRYLRETLGNGGQRTAG